jgi:putative nucleotidyltransferase with HDIG domain
MARTWGSGWQEFRDFMYAHRRTSGLAVPLLAGLLVWFLIGSAFAVNLYSQRVSVSAEDIAPRTVLAPFGVEDYAATARERARAAREAPAVYSIDSRVLSHSMAAANADFMLMGELARDPVVPMRAREQEAASLMPIDLPLSIWGEVLALGPTSLNVLQQDTQVILSSVLGNGVGVRDTATSLAEARGYASHTAALEEPDPGLRLFLTTLTASLIRPNDFINRVDTQANRVKYADNVQPVRILKGQVVITEGKVVSPGQVELLRELGLLNRGFDPGPLVGGLLFALVAVGALAAYVWGFRRQLLTSTSSLIISGAVLVAAVVAAESLTQVPGADFVIVPTVAITIAALVDTGLAVVVTGILALMTGLLAGTDLTTAMVAFFGGLAGIVGVSRLSARYDVVRVGLLVGVVNLLALVGLDFMEGASLLEAPVWHQLFWSFVDGGFAAMLAVGLTPFLEAPFGLVTAMRLIELTNPNQPLLRKLLVEAPGTYQHSIMVGNLAEAATEAVGGNSLLARVGAIYHDIGKVKRPYLFIDNQFGAENPHDRLSPSLSALIIASHVRDGVELAREHGLPPAVTDFIAQHHGTTVIRYFYEKARDQDTGEGVLEEDFRYDGPKPQSKEAAIVMLADASEATSRTLKNPNPEAIEQVVRRIIKDRLADGQLDEADLTLRDLDVIARTFTRVLTGVFHERIEYPDRVLKEMERSRERSHGGHGAKSARLLRRVGGNGPSGS